MIGIDEAGRGAWAGPLVVSGCYFDVLPEFFNLLNDSKVLSKASREQLYIQIIQACQTHSVVVSPKDIDDLGLTVCLQRAAREIADTLPRNCDIIIDGPYNFLKGSNHGFRTLALIRADAQNPEVMAASIVAKVTRDRLMRELGAEYPGYGFERHVGYGTEEHQRALERIGVSAVHRRSYRPIAKLLPS